MTSANETPGGYKFAPLVASQQGRANQHELACFGLSSPWFFPSRSGIPLHAVAQHFGFLCSDPFHHEMFRPLFRRSAPFPLVLGCSRPLVGVDALRSSRKHPIHSFFWPPTQPAPPTISPNITHFGGLASSMRVTNPANKIRLLRKVASMLSLPVLRSVSKYEIGWSARLCFRQPMQRVKDLWWARHSVS